MRFVGILASLYLAFFPGIAWALVNINTASVAELMTLKGIGEVKAQAIVDHRQQRGSFSVIEDIMKVTGIGTGTFDDIKHDIAVTGATTVVIPETDSSTSGSTSTVIATPGETSKLPMVGSRIDAPEFVYVNQPVRLEVTQSDGRTRAARYVWNFGDGTTEQITSPTHAYAYPGTYVIVVEGYYLKEFQSARHVLKVLPIDLTVTDNLGEIVITNSGAEEIDLSGMSLKGRGEFTFPKYSILLPGASLTIPMPGVGSVAVFDNAGKVAARPGGQAAGAKPPPPRPQTPAVATAKPPAVPPISSVAEASEVSGPVEMSASSNLAASAAAPASGFWPYLGLVGLIMLGLFGLWGGRRVD